MPEPTLHELNAHLFAALLPKTHGEKIEFGGVTMSQNGEITATGLFVASSEGLKATHQAAPKRTKKAAQVTLGDDQLDTEPTE